MKVFRLLGVTLFGMLFLPLLFVQAQDQRTKGIDHRINEDVKTFIGRGKIEDRRKALDDLFRVAARAEQLAEHFALTGLRDPDDEIRIKAVQGIAHVGPTAGRGGLVVGRLIRALQNDEHPQVRSGAASALGSILFRGSNPNHAKEAIPALADAMRKDKDSLVRWNACRAFRVIGPLAKDAAPDLVEAIKEKDDLYMRDLACDSLGAVACPDCKRIVPALLEIYKKEEDENWKVKGTILGSLGKIGDKEEIVIPLMIESLRDPKKMKFRGGTAYGIGQFGRKAKSAVPALISALDVSGYSEKTEPGRAEVVLVSVLDALGSIGPDAKEAIPAIRKIAQSQDPSHGPFCAERALKAIEKK